MKYMGSKSRIAKHIVPIIQSCIDNNDVTTYIEPFVGGANIIDKIECKNKIGSDLNKYLIALLNHVEDDNPLYREVSKELYDQARDCFNNGRDDFEDWELGNIGFLASYNGRWFDGGYAKAGYEKTKSGQRYRDYYQESKNNLLAQAQKELFKDCCFVTRDYLEYGKMNLKDCVIYLDPPYSNVKKYRNATSFDYDRFWDFAREMSKENIVLVSELDAPNDFKCIWEKEVSRSIKPNDKSKANEKLFILNKAKLYL